MDGDAVGRRLGVAVAPVTAISVSARVSERSSLYVRLRNGGDVKAEGPTGRSPFVCVVVTHGGGVQPSCCSARSGLDASEEADDAGDASVPKTVADVWRSVTALRGTVGVGLRVDAAKKRARSRRSQVAAYEGKRCDSVFCAHHSCCATSFDA